MFQFMRKDKDKAKTASGTSSDKGSSFSKKVKDKLSPDDLHRLDEIRRSFKLGKAKKEKQKLPSGIIADYSENFVHPPTTAVQQSVTMPSLKSAFGEDSNAYVSVSVTHSDSSESSLSAKSLNLPVPAQFQPPEIPAKPPRATPAAASTRSPPPVPARPSTSRYSNDYSNAELGSHHGYSPSRPPTSASTLSFTPSFVTPPQSPNHNIVSPTKFYVDPELDLGDQVIPKAVVKHGYYRMVTVERLSPERDFGFSVRKSSIISTGGNSESILFVEPSQAHGVRDFGDGYLLPGDRLIAVNNIRTDSKARDDVIDMIRSSSNQVTLKVQSASHWIENIDKINPEQEENSYSSKEGNYVWMVHKSGFVKARIVEKIDETGRCKVQLDTGQSYVICEDDIENFNPTSFDLLPYLWNLNMINESSILHTLRNRFHSSVPCTIVTNNVMLFLSKNAKLDLETQHLLKSVTHPFTYSKLLPNIYSSAQQAYRSMVINRRHQSIVIHGESNISVKKEIVREVLSYLSETKGSKVEKVLTLSSTNTITIPSFLERLLALTDLVEFFCFSSNDTQYEKSTVMYNLEFDLGGRMIGINSQIFLLDVERLYEAAPYFGIIQALHDLSTCPVDLLGPHPILKQLKKDLKLTDTDADSSGNKLASFFLSEIGSSSDPESSLIQISKILSSMVTLGLGEAFSKSVWSVFGAIYHLGHVVGTVSDALQNETRGSSSKNIEIGQQHFKSACSLLGLSLDNVEKTLIMDDNDISRVRNVLGFSVGLFIDTVNSLFTTANKSNSVGFRNVQCLSVNIIQVGSSTVNKSARFGDLGSNYLNDRISKLLKQVNFDRLEKLYQSENITYETNSANNEESESFKEEYFMNQYESLPLLDSFPSVANNSSKTKGLLYFLDDAKEPARCLEKFESEFYGENQYKNLYSVDFRNTTLTMAHSNGTHIVEYDIKKILNYVDVSSASKFTNVLIQDSKKDNINCMFLKTSNSVIGVCISAAAPDGSLRRTASIRRNYSTNWQKKSATVNIKIQTDYLTDVLARTQIQSIKCLNPYTRSNGDVDVPSLRRQIRSDNIADLIRFFKSSYPLHMAQTDFVRRFKCLGNAALNEEGFNVHQRVTDIFDKQDLASSSFKFGNSMVFMKPWVLDELERKQTQKLEELFTGLQSRCRGSLIRKRLENLKIRDVAIKCIQKNVRKLLAVRYWPWWKLYQQISPLLKVQSSHEKLQSTQDELSSLKLRFEKVETERNRLKLENEKLEIRVNELGAELSEEQATSAASVEKIEQEMAEKGQLENQLTNLKTRFQSLENEKQQLELDLAYSISDVNGDGGATPDEFSDESVYKQRWERCKRELEMMKQRLKQREQDHVDQIMIMKKSLEKKCSDAWEESEEQRQIVAQLKRRIQKLSSELSDVKCLHQEEASRSALFEKKQRRFDNELSTLNMQLEKEKINKDKIIRERDAAVIQKDSIFNEMQALKMELQLKETKLHNVEQELEEVSHSGGSSEQVNALRKAKNDLQIKTKEQEEELDDLAGQVQTLESTKLRLEMQMEQMRKENKREIQQREEEIEDLRSCAHKKVKALECQLEAEHEERSTILRAKQELERKLFDLEELSSSQNASQEQISRLKKELKRAKALLKDAQAMAEQSKNDVLSKGMLRQLRHQLEDSESQRQRLNRAKQKVEEELSDAQIQIDELTRRCSEAENDKNALLREKANIQIQYEEGEEQLAEVMKKYKAAVEQLSVDQTTITEQCIQISELEAATSSLKETIAELTAKLETLEGDQASHQIQKRFQLKVRELETRLELETTTKTRLEGQVVRLKEHIEKYQEDLKNLQTREYTAMDKLKKCERQLRDSKEEVLRLTQRESDAQTRRANLDKQLESADLEISTLKGDLKLAMQRIEDLTTAIRECDETTDDDDSSTESIGSNNDSSMLSDAQFDLDNIKLHKNNESLA